MKLPNWTASTAVLVVTCCLLNFGDLASASSPISNETTHPPSLSVPTTDPATAGNATTVAIVTTSATSTALEPLLVTTIPVDATTLNGGKEAPSLGDAVKAIKTANWTSVVKGIQDPANRDYIVVVLILASAILCFFGYYCLRVWLFMGGFLSASAAFYIFAPKVFDTDVCCGSGTEQTHILISAGIGVASGILALWILKIGVFLTGSCLGLGLSLVLRSVLAQLNIFHTDLSFAMFYAGAGLVGGLFALYREKPIIVFVTACVGAFGMCLGIGYFENCEFMEVVRAVEEDMTLHHKNAVPLSKCHRILAGVWVLLSIVGVLMQYQARCFTSCQEGVQESRRQNPRNQREVFVLREVVSNGQRRHRSRQSSSSNTRRSKSQSLASRAMRRFRRTRRTRVHSSSSEEEEMFGTQRRRGISSTRNILQPYPASTTL